MIIKRKYEIFSKLIERDLDARMLIEENIKNEKEYIKSAVLSPDNNIFPYLADIGSGLVNIPQLLAEFDKLDIEKPYDNGLNYQDVTEVHSYSSRKGNAIEIIMVSKKVETPLRIVQVIAVENDKDGTKLITPWSVNAIL